MADDLLGLDRDELRGIITALRAEVEMWKEAANAVPALRADVEKKDTALRRCRIVLDNMALENEGAVFNRWPISHEPLRSDAKNLLPVLDAALTPSQEKQNEK